MQCQMGGIAPRVCRARYESARRISLPAERDSKKSGQSGSDVPAPRERDNGADGPESPEIF